MTEFKTEEFDDIDVEYGDTWIGISQRGEGNVCVPLNVLSKIEAHYQGGLYKIFSIGETSELLAIMKLSVMREVFGLQTSAMARVESETENGGICDLHFRRPVPGFGHKVLVQKG
jgi:hypothetical protein